MWWVLCVTGAVVSYVAWFWMQPAGPAALQGTRCFGRLWWAPLALACLTSWPLLSESVKMGGGLPWMSPPPGIDSILSPGEWARAGVRTVWRGWWGLWPDKSVAWVGVLLVLWSGFRHRRNLLKELALPGKIFFIITLAGALALLLMLTFAVTGVPLLKSAGPLHRDRLELVGAIFGGAALHFYFVARGFLAFRGGTSGSSASECAALRALSYWLPIGIIVAFLWSMTLLKQDGGIPGAVHAIAALLLAAAAVLPFGFVLVDGSWTKRFFSAIKVLIADASGLFFAFVLLIVHMLPAAMLLRWVLVHWEPCWARTLAGFGVAVLWHALALWLATVFAVIFAGAWLPPGWNQASQSTRRSPPPGKWTPKVKAKAPARKKGAKKKTRKKAPTGKTKRMPAKKKRKTTGKRGGN